MYGNFPFKNAKYAVTRNVTLSGEKHGQMKLKNNSILCWMWSVLHLVMDFETNLFKLIGTKSSQSMQGIITLKATKC